MNVDFSFVLRMFFIHACRLFVWIGSRISLGLSKYIFDRINVYRNDLGIMAYDEEKDRKRRACSGSKRGARRRQNGNFRNLKVKGLLPIEATLQLFVGEDGHDGFAVGSDIVDGGGEECSDKMLHLFG